MQQCAACSQVNGTAYQFHAGLLAGLALEGLSLVCSACSGGIARCTGGRKGRGGHIEEGVVRNLAHILSAWTMPWTATGPHRDHPRVWGDNHRQALSSLACRGSCQLTMKSTFCSGDKPVRQALKPAQSACRQHTDTGHVRGSAGQHGASHGAGTASDTRATR